MIKIQISDWFILVQVDSSDFRVASDWLQIAFRILSGKLGKKSDFRLVEICSDWLENESPWIFAELFCL